MTGEHNHTMALRTTLKVLADLHLQFGFVDVSEHRERFLVAHWITSDQADNQDPRYPIMELESSEDDPAKSVVERGPGTGSPATPSDPDWLELLVLNKWVFTRSDPDTYPSAPHGHLHSPNRSWPKLNPYTGRVFKAKDQELCRLSKSQMQTLWGMQEFRDFCRSYVVWYMEAHSHHKFGVRYPLRFPRW